MNAPGKLAPGWRPFTKSDWDGWAGANRFENGAEPLINEVAFDGVEAVAIIDGSGASIISFEDTGKDLRWRQACLWSAIAGAWLALQPAGTNFTTAELEPLGFEIEAL